MHSDFKEWLMQVTSPEQSTTLIAGYELLETINGAEMEELTTDIVNRTDLDDVFQILGHTQGECLRFSDQTLQRFEVRLRQSALEYSNQPLLNALLTTLSTVDAYELPAELLAIVSHADTPEETLADLVESVTGVDSADILAILEDVSPSLISTLRDILEEQTETSKSTESVNAVIDTDALKRILSYVETHPTALQSNDPIVHYITVENGTLGLPIGSYVTYFQSVLADTSDTKLTALRWVLVCLMAGVNATAIPEHIGVLMERLAFDVEDTMRIRPAILELLKEVFQ